MSAADSDTGGRRARPLSPHLQIYRPIITMVMSIMHRVTGVINVGGLLLVVGYLMALALGEPAYEAASGLYGSVAVRILLVAFTWSLIHHMLGGLRHAVWDIGRGFGEERYTMSWATLIGSVTLTACLWVVVVILETV